jgi:Ca-activated chloride channel family protein
VTLLAEPQALALLLVLPALWLLGRHAGRERAESLRRFGDPGLLALSSRLPEAHRIRGYDALRWLALAVLAVALARPQWGRQPRALARTGRDLIVALDLSRSMRVDDAGGMRLRTAKRLAWQLAAARAGDRIGLVIFGGAGFLQLPPTSDLATFQLFLDRATFDDIGDPSTDIAAGLKVAERALRREGTAIGSRAVLLLSDGERSEGPLDPILELYRHARLPVFAVGVGTTPGGRVPADSGSALGPWHLDNIGRPVVSRLDEDALRRIGQESAGAYARWDDPGALETMTRGIANLEARALAAEPANEPTERYQWPLAVAVLLLVTEQLLKARATASRGQIRAAAVTGAASLLPSYRAIGRAAGALVLAALLSCVGRTREAIRGRQLYDQGKYLEAYEAYQAVLRQQGGPELRYNAGNALYRLKQYTEASKSWREAMPGGSDMLRQEAFYNMGNAFVRASEDANALSGYLERALDAYEEALRLNPGDQDAKWNLEIALQKRGDPGQEGSRGRGGRADYGPGSHNEGYEGNRQSAVGAMAGGGQGGDEGESVEEMDPEQARSLLEAVERQQLSTHEGKRPRSGPGGDRDW